MSKTRKDYAKRSESTARNRMIVEMWHTYPNRTMTQIADTFNVSVGTVHRVIHRHLELSDPIYDILAEVNECRKVPYSQQTVTRAWVAVRRWYPSVQTLDQFKTLTVGSDVDNSPSISAACEDLITNAIDALKWSDEVNVQ